MAITTQQKAQLDFDTISQAPFRKLELVRIAKDTLVENDRSKPADERGVTAADITAYADTLYTYVTDVGVVDVVDVVDAGADADVASN